jgi:hypothetical protein
MLIWNKLKVVGTDARDLRQSLREQQRWMLEQYGDWVQAKFV